MSGRTHHTSIVALCLGLRVCLAQTGNPIVPSDGQVFVTNTVLVAGTYHLPTGVAIGASGVTLDLNGATLVGSNFNNYGVSSLGHNDVVIRNGTIRGYYYGIRAESGAHVQILNNDLSYNWVDPNSQGGSAPFLNINVGPTLGDQVNLGGGLFGRNLTGAIIASNTMRFEENGMDLYHVQSSTISANNASDNTGWGVHLNGSVSNIVQGNVADRCIRINLGDSSGFLLVYGSSWNQVLSNSFQYGGDGFFSGNENGCPSDNNLVQGNNGSYAAANAFEATFESGNRFIANIANFSNYGFWLGYSHDGNIISSNSIRWNNVSGIEIEHGQHNLIEGNDIIGNGGSGIVLRTDGQPHFPSNTACLNLPNPAASSGYTIRGNRMFGNFGTAMTLTSTTDSLIYNNLFGGPYGGTVISDGSNNVWSITPAAGTNIVGGATLGGNWWFNYSGSDTNADGLGDTSIPYTNTGQIAAPGDPHPLIGTPNLAVLANPQTLGDFVWLDLGRNTRTNGAVFDTSNGTHFATDGTNLLLLESANSGRLSRLDPGSSRYVPLAPVPEPVNDGGDFQYGGGRYFATVGLSFNPTNGSGNGPRLYSYNPVAGTWSSNSPTTVSGHLVCNEALAYDPVSNRLYATIVGVLAPSSGGDSTLLTKLAIYDPTSDAWIGVTAPAADSWSAGSEAEYVDGSIYVWRGGFSGASVNGSDSYLSVYNIRSNTWSRTPSLRDSGVAPGFRTGGFDVWGISLTSDAAHRRLFVMGAESNHQLYVFDLATQTWSIGPNAPYDGGWGGSIEFVSSSGRLYQIDGRDSAGSPQGTAVLLRFILDGVFQQPSSVRLSWNAAGGKSYQAQYKTNLSQANWLNAGSPIMATNPIMSAPYPAIPEPQRFYRVVYQP